MSSIHTRKQNVDWKRAVEKKFLFVTRFYTHTQKRASLRHQPENIVPLNFILTRLTFCLISVTVVKSSYKPFCVQTYTHTYTQGCSAHFSSLIGYQYHHQRCGREFSDDEKPVFLCQHCGKNYRSKAGRDYHVRTEHPPTITPTTTTNNYKNVTDVNTGRDMVSTVYY